MLLNFFFDFEAYKNYCNSEANWQIRPNLPTILLRIDQVVPATPYTGCFKVNVH